MKLAILGSNWGQAYARTLEKLGIDFQIGRTWRGCDGVIVATPPDTHYELAREILTAGYPLILEKPITTDPSHAWGLVKLGGIAYASHTRLYSPSWRKFKASLTEIHSIDCVAGGTARDPWWDWGPHLAAMCLDLGFDPRKAEIHCEQDKIPLSFLVNGVREWQDEVTDPTPVEVLVTEFVAAIERGEPNNEGLNLGAQVVGFLHEFRGLHKR
jgi:hypothetical protein